MIINNYWTRQHRISRFIQASQVLSDEALAESDNILARLNKSISDVAASNNCFIYHVHSVIEMSGIRARAAQDEQQDDNNKMKYEFKQLNYYIIIKYFKNIHVYLFLLAIIYK